MIDIKFIRDNPEEFDRLLTLRGLEPKSREILERDTWIREKQTEIQLLQEELNLMSKIIGIRKQIEKLEPLINEITKELAEK